jgi:hypothetical protein
LNKLWCVIATSGRKRRSLWPLSNGNELHYAKKVAFVVYFPICTDNKEMKMEPLRRDHKGVDGKMKAGHWQVL